MEKGELHWDRIDAGDYQTMYYANGYRYYVHRFMDRRTPRWRAHYVWDKQKDKKNLRPLFGVKTAYYTLKTAKRACLIHNLNPRPKYKFVGRAQNVGKNPARHPCCRNTNYASTRWNMMVFQQVKKNGELDEWNPKFIDPMIFGHQDYSQTAANREMLEVAGKVSRSRGELPVSCINDVVEKYPAFDGKPVEIFGWKDYASIT